ncbi:hypothetical protein [Streptomyces sp. NPDC054865]
MALPLIRQTLSTDQWAHFCQVHTRHIGQDATRLLPWLLEGADQPAVRRLLAQLPAHVYAACTVRWIPAYTALDPWSPGSARLHLAAFRINGLGFRSYRGTRDFQLEVPAT